MILNLLPVGSGAELQEKKVRIELNCRTSAGVHRSAWCGDDPSHLVVRSTEYKQSTEKREQNFTFKDKKSGIIILTICLLLKADSNSIKC